MSSPPDNRAYFESIQLYFLERTGRGLMLSSRDLELMIGWCSAGVPSVDICRGIDEAVDTLRDVPRDLHAMKRFIEPRLSETRSAAPIFESSTPTQNEPSDPWAVALDTVATARQHAVRPEITASCTEVSRRIREAREANSDPWSALYELDDFMVRDVFERLGEDERRLIDLEIEGQHGAHLSMMTDVAREETMLASRRRALRDRWQLPSLTE